MIEVYEVDGGARKKLDWKGTINPAVAQLAGYSIVKEEHNCVHRYFVKRRMCNRL